MFSSLPSSHWSLSTHMMLTLPLSAVRLDALVLMLSMYYSMLWCLHWHQSSWFRWWFQQNQLWNHCNVQSKRNASKVTRQNLKSRMLVNTHRGMRLDTSSVCCWKHYIEIFIHNSRQRYTAEYPATTGASQQLVASRGIVLGTLFTVNLHDPPKLSLLREWHRSWNGRRPMCYLICRTNLVFRWRTKWH